MGKVLNYNDGCDERWTLTPEEHQRIVEEIKKKTEAEKERSSK